MDYVSEQAQEAALEMEQDLKRLPPKAGVMFASVQPVPAPRGEVKEYRVFVGMPRGFDPRTGEALVLSKFREQIEGGIKISPTVVVGIRGSSP